MIAKSSFLFIFLTLSSILCDTSLKLKTLNTLNNRLHSENSIKKSNTKIKKKVENKSLATTQSSQCIDKGMGFKGFQLKDIATLLTKIKGNQPTLEEFSKYIQPILNIAAGKATNFFDFAIGDYKGGELATMDNLLCDVVPLEENSSFGTVAFKISNLPCGKPTSVNACFTFSQCGSFTLAFNGGLLGCAVSTTGIGEIVAPFLDVIEHVGVGFSVNNRIVENLYVYSYNSEESSFEGKEVTAKGNLYFTLGVSVADMIFPEDVEIAGQKLADLFEIKGRMNIIIDFGKTFSNLSNVIQKARSGTKVGSMSIIKSFLQSGAEIALAIKASFSFKLSDLTKTFLPDLEIANLDFNMLTSLGNGNSGVSKGIYLTLRTQLSFLQSFYDTFKNTIGKIINFFGIEFPNLDLSVNIEAGISVQAEVLGLILKGNFAQLGGSLTCLYSYSNDKLSCKGFNSNPFTIIKEGLQWVIKKADKFFDMVGDEIRVAFSDVKKKIISNIIKPASRFFQGEGRIPTSCPDGMHNSVGLCYPKCKDGYYGIMAQCIQECPSSFRNDGYYCFKPSAYGRGSGYAVWDKKKCRKRNKEYGCEKYGAMYYPTCKPGFRNIGCCICSPRCPSGMTDIGISCQKDVYGRGVGKLPGCGSDEDSIAGLCYKKKTNIDYLAQYSERKKFKQMNNGTESESF